MDFVEEEQQTAVLCRLQIDLFFCCFFLLFYLQYNPPQTVLWRVGECGHHLCLSVCNVTLQRVSNNPCLLILSFNRFFVWHSSWPLHPQPLSWKRYLWYIWKGWGHMSLSWRETGSVLRIWYVLCFAADFCRIEYFDCDFISFKSSWYTFRETTLVKLFFPSEKGSALKWENLLPLGANSFILEQTPLKRDLVCSKANRKWQQLSPF